MTREQTEKFIKVATGHARVVRSKPTEQEQAVALAVLRNRATIAKMTAKQRKAAILRGSF